MKLGIIADTHDNLRTLHGVLDRLKNIEKVEVLIHCGDWSMPFSMRTYVGFGKPIRGVLGNADPDIEKFKYQLQNLEMLKGIDMQIKHRFLDLVYDGKRLAVIHGDDDDLNNALVESQLYDVVCLGHTHIPLIKHMKKTTVINPGSLIGFFAERGILPITYGVYDTSTSTARVMDYEKDIELNVLVG